MPRRIIASAFISLDGVMQAPGGPQEDYTGGFAEGDADAGKDEAGEGEGQAPVEFYGKVSC